MKISKKLKESGPIRATSLPH